MSFYCELRARKELKFEVLVQSNFTKCRAKLAKSFQKHGSVACEMNFATVRLYLCALCRSSNLDFNDCLCGIWYSISDIQPKLRFAGTMRCLDCT